MKRVPVGYAVSSHGSQSHQNLVKMACTLKHNAVMGWIKSFMTPARLSVSFHTQSVHFACDLTFCTTKLAVPKLTVTPSRFGHNPMVGIAPGGSLSMNRAA